MTTTPKVDILLGLQWGDEGKGKVVDVLTPHYDIIARFQGGPNAGHTLEFDGQKHVLRSIPSGVFQEGKINVIGGGVVFDPVLFSQEARELMASGAPDLPRRLKISRKAHMILPTHRLLDAQGERRKGAAKIGTTGKGIGPTYTDKVSRNGLRLGDRELPDFHDRYLALRDRHLEQLGITADDIADREREWLDALQWVADTFELVDGEYYINEALDEGRTVLCEGAQGTMLDVDYGSYPFVTSSNTVATGACSGLGVAPRRIGDVYGIFKAYCTRVGAGPFPTELHDDTGALMRDRGHEYGAVTGRERRCGWIDLVALRYAIMLSGVTKLIMMKSDVLDTFDTIRACTAYDVDGRRTRRFPYCIDDSRRIEPVYTDIPGWHRSLSACKTAQQLPEAFKSYVRFLEGELGVPIVIASVGPDREQTIILK